MKDAGIQQLQVQRGRRRVYEREFKLHAMEQIEQGMSTTQLSRELGLSSNILGRWMREIKSDPMDAFRGKGRRKPVHAMLHQLRRENMKLKVERMLLRTGMRSLSMKPDVAFNFIQKHQTTWPVRWMCEIFDVSHSGYYDWLKRQRAGMD